MINFPNFKELVIQLAGHLCLSKCEAVRSIKNCPKKSRAMILWLFKGGQSRDNYLEGGDLSFFDSSQWHENSWGSFSS